MEFPELDWPAATARIEAFIQTQTAEAGMARAVVGVSGGVDSAVACTLCARALGAENVRAVSMPSSVTSDDSCAEARILATELDVELVTIDIASQLDDYFERFPDADRIRRGNKAARERMSVLYDQAKVVGGLVCGTGNKTEALLGYTTLWGDMACDFNPVGDLYKTDIRRLARWLDVPESICARPPSAELWAGQTDEDELGFSYDEVDLLLWAMIDRGMFEPELLEAGFTPGFIEDVNLRIEASAHKRRLAPVCLAR